MAQHLLYAFQAQLIGTRVGPVMAKSQHQQDRYNAVETDVEKLPRFLRGTYHLSLRLIFQTSPCCRCSFRHRKHLFAVPCQVVQTNGHVDRHPSLALEAGLKKKVSSANEQIPFPCHPTQKWSPEVARLKKKGEFRGQFLAGSTTVGPLAQPPSSFYQKRRLKDGN